MSNSQVLPRLQVLAAALLFSTGGVAIKSCGLSSWQVASFRCGVAAVALGLLLPRVRQRWTVPTVVVGLAYAATMVLYVLSNKATTAANAIFLQSTAPLYILLLAPLLLGERNQRRDLLWMAGLAFGMALFFIGQESPSKTAPNPALGNLVAAGAGLSWALTVLGLRWLGREGGQAAAAVVAGNVIAFFLALPMALPLAASRPADWGWVLYLGIFQIAIAYVMLTRAVETVPAFEVSLLLLIDPILSPIWAWWAHGEVPGHWALIGGAIVLLVTTLKTWQDS